MKLNPYSRSNEKLFGIIAGTRSLLEWRKNTRRNVMGLVILFLLSCAFSGGASAQSQSQFQPGTFFFGSLWTSSDGLRSGQLCSGTGNPCAFNAASTFDSAGNIYLAYGSIPNFGVTGIAKFDSYGRRLADLVTLDAAGSVNYANPLRVTGFGSIVLDAQGNAFVAVQTFDGLNYYVRTVLEIDTNGRVVNSWSIPGINFNGIRSIDLSANQHTLYVSGNTVLSVFSYYTTLYAVDLSTKTVTTLPCSITGEARVLPDGSLLAANGTTVNHCDAQGNRLASFSIPGVVLLLPVALDPGGQTAVVVDYYGGPARRIDIASGQVTQLSANLGGYDLAIYRGFRAAGSIGQAWGSNAYGQFGNGTLTSSPTPVPVSNLSGLVAVAGGGGHSLWLKSDGTVWTSGLNNVGQLGSGGAYPNCPASSTTPVQVSSLSSVAAIAGGFTHSLALKSDGTVWVWGEGLDGELGNGIFTRSCTPVQVSSLSGMVAVAAGDFHNVALKSDGTVWAWGFGINGQLGNGTFIGSAVPVQVSNLSGVVAVGAGGDNGFAVKSDGTAWAWGQGVFGLLGNGATANSSTPVQVSNLSGVVRVASGMFAISSLALKSDGTVWIWGSGELGNGMTYSLSTTPIQVSGLSGITAVAGGEGFHQVLKNDGTVWAWGANNVGQLGNCALADSLTPVQVSNLSGVTAIGAGRGFSLAIGVSTPGCGVPLVPLTVTADYVTRSYGQANPGLTASYAGFINGDTPAVLSGALSCMTTATQNSPVGNYAITCSGLTSTKYDITFVPGQLTITQAPLTITANNATRPYGQANPVFSATYSGFVNGETPSVLSGTLSCTSNATPSSPVSISSYAINCSGQSSTNYAIAYAAGNLTITPVPLTITANNATKILNAALPAFSASYTAFANGENSSVLAGTLSCTTTATANSPIGSYPINCSGQTSSNYAIKFVSATLKIIYAPAGVCGHTILPPINADGSTVGKQGRTFPAKFQVCDANGVSIGTPGVVASFYLTQIITGTVTTNVVDIVDTNNPDTAFRWAGDQWIFNITTSNLAAGSTYVYTITLNDGSTINFQFGLR